MNSDVTTMIIDSIFDQEVMITLQKEFHLQGKHLQKELLRLHQHQNPCRHVILISPIVQTMQKMQNLKRRSLSKPRRVMTRLLLMSFRLLHFLIVLSLRPQLHLLEFHSKTRIPSPKLAKN